MTARKHRRVRTEPVPGSDPRPQEGAHAIEKASEDSPAGWGGASPSGPRPSGDNDERLRRDKPPHWG